MVAEPEGELFLDLYFRLLIFWRIVETHDEGESGAQESVDGESSDGFPVELYVPAIVGTEQVEV